MKSQTTDSDTILPVRCKQRFVDLCRAQSKNYPLPKGSGGAKMSAARFLKKAAEEKLLKLGFDKEYLKSIT